MRQAARLMDGQGHLELLAADEVAYPAAVTGMTIAAYTEEYAAELHGIKALGSVSERVAHEAHCSTLIVRTSQA